MSSVTISSDYLIEIPQEVREQMSLRPGQELSVVCYNGQIALAPDKPLREARGMLKGMNTEISRDED